MNLRVDDLVLLAGRVAAAIDPRFHVAAVTSSDEDAGRAELMITVTGCHASPCTIILNISRRDRETLERELEAKLREALTDHVAL